MTGIAWPKSARRPAGSRREYVVNASGVRLGEVSALAGGEVIRMWPRKGEYWLLDREFGTRLRRIVFAAPTKESKGVHVIPTAHGNALLGPSSDDLDDPDDKSTSEERLQQVFEQTRRLVPSVSLDQAIKSFAANRPACEERVIVRFDAGVANLLHVTNRSSGVGSSLGTADHVRGPPSRRPGWTWVSAPPRRPRCPRSPACTTTLRPRRSPRSTRDTARSCACASR